MLVNLDNPSLIDSYVLLAKLQDRSLSDVVRDVLEEGLKYYAPFLPIQRHDVTTLSTPDLEISLPVLDSGFVYSPPQRFLQMEALLILSQVLNLSQTVEYQRAMQAYVTYVAGDNPFKDDCVIDVDSLFSIIQATLEVLQ